MVICSNWIHLRSSRDARRRFIGAYFVAIRDTSLIFYEFFLNEMCFFTIMIIWFLFVEMFKYTLKCGSLQNKIWYYSALVPKYLPSEASIPGPSLVIVVAICCRSSVKPRPSEMLEKFHKRVSCWDVFVASLSLSLHSSHWPTQEAVCWPCPWYNVTSDNSTPLTQWISHHWWCAQVIFLRWYLMHLLGAIVIWRWQCVFWMLDILQFRYFRTT